MPEISRFLGVVIRMHFDEHGPPHFHAAYGDDEAAIRIESVGLLAGDLPPRALALVIGLDFIRASCSRIGSGSVPAKVRTESHRWSHRCLSPPFIRECPPPGCCVLTCWP